MFRLTGLSTKKKWLIGIAGIAMLGMVSLFVAAFILARRYEPYIHRQALEYLEKRFDSEVELATLRVHLPKTSPLHLLLTKGRGALARVEGGGILLRHKGRRDVPPMFSIRKFRFEVELGNLFDTQKIIPSVLLEGMEITVPPKGERPNLNVHSSPGNGNESQIEVLIKEVMISDARLVILPKDSRKIPLEFAIHNLRLRWYGRGAAMQYDATLTIPKPPGAIRSIGNFGPWKAAEPGDTPLSGDYTFGNADLGVFAAIAGILSSTGHFEGTLDTIRAKGQASVPDFRLKKVGNSVPLITQFEVLVDGTNGNTILQPVSASLGTTKFTTGGGIIKHEGDLRRAISLDVLMPRGDLRDLLRLAMKGNPFMEGRIFLKTKIDIPPLTGKVREKLRLDGRFEVRQGKFLNSATQDNIDNLSRRGQGRPNSEEIDEVVSGMKGTFKLENEVIRFRSLSFGVPGAKVDLKGSYDLHRDSLDFHGTLKLQARVSQTMTGWKRWVMKPVDPFFAREGAGTFFHIEVTGKSKAPKFGLDHGKTGSI